jgi:hypothetical protein
MGTVQQVGQCNLELGANACHRARRDRWITINPAAGKGDRQVVENPLEFLLALSPAAPLLNSSNRIDPNPAHLAFHGQTALPGEGIGGCEPGSTAMMNAPYLRTIDGLGCDGWGAETTAEHPGESPSRRWQAGWLAERLRREDPARSCRVIDSDEVGQGLPTQHA